MNRVLLSLLAVFFLLGCQDRKDGRRVPSVTKGQNAWTESKTEPIKEEPEDKHADDRGTITQDGQNDAATAALAQISLMSLDADKSEWRRALNTYPACGRHSVILEGDEFIPSTDVVSTAPPLVLLDNLTVEKARGLNGETVFVVEGDLRTCMKTSMQRAA